MSSKKTRIDLLLVKRGLAESRQKAQALILSGKVFYSMDGLNFHPVLKPGEAFPESVILQIKEDIPYVSRGGLKLEGALKVFEINPEGMVCLDVGASTGGFTHCLLLKGAQKIYAVDVGKGQLHFKLRNHPQVILMENINARYLTPDMFPEKFDLITVDVSFISLEKILPVLIPLLKAEGLILALIKPQFELSPKEVKKGVVRDPKLHFKVVQKIWSFAESLGLRPLGVAESSIPGAKGNKEFFICLKKQAML
ncbi:RNA methyltransferase [Caldimicrobium thiodismutans]|uniref:RNA methyltransferase n=1 Tax=Caldimicrobium thiodismutans TaxID=1653476 RepID=A0A0U5BXC1_9BACT|nr:TlyA family RNA methyltransferase [Caldimicrobium thiodismutans]BAU23349.1 RNA methyltransferase [Caldimicrobium thiodismutans]